MEESEEEQSIESISNNSESYEEEACDEEESFEMLIDKLRKQRIKETRHSEEKLTRMESVIRQQQSEIDNLTRIVKLLKSQEFQKKSKYEETSSAPSLSSEESNDESDFEDEGIYSAPNTSAISIDATSSSPLLTDLILETVFKYLDLKSLLMSRLVCRKWHKESLPFLVKKSDRVILEVSQPWKPSKGQKLSKFMQEMKCSIEMCPVCKYVIKNFSNLSELEEFFQKFGPTIRSLDLHFDKSFRNTSAFRRILFEYAPVIENLRIECCDMLKEHHFWEYSNYEGPSSKLTSLKGLYFGNIRDSIMLSRPWISELLTMTPNLKKLILQARFKDNGNAFIQRVLESFLLVGNIANLKLLCISSINEDNLNCLLQLANKGLRLKTFIICLLPDFTLLVDDIDPDTITNFLATQAQTLETFRLDQKSNKVHGFSFPVMPALKHLSLTSYCDLFCGQLNYFYTFPNLESLALRGYDVFPYSDFFPYFENVPCTATNVKRLSLPSGLRDENTPFELAKLFPLVTDLEIRGASNEFLKNVWKSWPKLQKLKMVLSHLDGCLDPGITGIPIDVCSNIRRTHNYNLNLEDIKEAPSLSDMLYLQELQIECRSIWIPCGILSDISGYFAISKLKSLLVLNFIEIGVPEQFDLSDKCIRHIYETLKDAEITLRIVSDHGRWRLELEDEEAATNMYESEPLLEDHNKDKVYSYEC